MYKIVNKMFIISLKKRNVEKNLLLKQNYLIILALFDKNTNIFWSPPTVILFFD